MMWVSRVQIAADAYLVCLHHALTTEKEEVLGLLVGQYTEGADGVKCDIYSAVTLRRSDKRKDRVEISPEMLIEAQQKAEQMSEACGQDLNIVGWYHSHPHITVWPSDIDLQTQAGYQQMDNRFIGLIFSVYNEDKKTKVGTHQVTCFQAINQNPERESPQYVRLAVPLQVTPQPKIHCNNQQALASLCCTLYEEQNEVLEASRQRSGQYPLAHLHNASVLVRSVCNLTSLVSGPLVATIESQLKHLQVQKHQLQHEVTYLRELLKENNVNVKTAAA